MPPEPVRPALDQITVSNELANFDYDSTADDYTSQLLEKLKSVFYGYLENGGTGISPAVQEAEMAINRSRIDAETEIALDRGADAAYEAMGWERPPGALIAMHQETLNHNARLRMEAANQITMKSFDLAQQNTQHVQDLTQRVETDLMNYKVQYGQYGVAVFRTRIDKWVALIQRDTAEAEIKSKWNRDQVELYRAYIRNRGTAYDAIMRGFEGQLRQNVAAAEVEDKANMEKVSLYDTETRSKTGLYGSQVKGFEAAARERQTEAVIWNCALSFELCICSKRSSAASSRRSTVDQRPSDSSLRGCSKRHSPETNTWPNSLQPCATGGRKFSITSSSALLTDLSRASMGP